MYCLYILVMKPTLSRLGLHCWRLVPMLAAPATLLLSQGQAMAILNVNIFDDGPNLKISVSGSLSSRHH